MDNKLIKATRIEHQKYPLSGLDLVFGFHYVDTVCFLDKDYDIFALEPALQETLNRLPVLGGKLIRDNNQLILDTDGPGVEFSCEIVDQPAPEFAGIAFPISGYDFFNPLPPIFNVDISEMPLLSIKITTFSDGIKCIGIRHNHAIMDGAATYAFLSAWTDCAEGRDFNPVIFSRETVTKLADRKTGLPSANAGIRVTNGRLDPTPPIFFQNLFRTVEIHADFKRLLELAKTQLKGIVSINHLMSALVFKAYGLSSKEGDGEIARVNQSYDMRMVRGSPLPFSFFGNAVLFRCMQLTFGDLRSIDIISLAQNFKQLAQPDFESMSQDIGFYQLQYEQGAYNKAGIFNNFSTVMGNGGLYLNNLVHFLDHPAWSNFFSGKLIGGDIVLPRIFGVRTTILIPSIKRELLLRLALEDYQAPVFLKAWAQLLDDVCSRDFSTLAE